MDDQTSSVGPDKRVPPSGRDKRVPPKAELTRGNPMSYEWRAVTLYVVQGGGQAVPLAPQR